MESVLSLRSSSQQNASAFCVWRALLGLSGARTGTLAERLKRNRPWPLFAGWCKFSSSVSSGDGSCMRWVPNLSLYPGDIRHSYFQCRNQLPRFYHANTSADLCCHNRLGLRFAATDEHVHVCCESESVHKHNPTTSAHWDNRKIHRSITRGVNAGVALPLSLRMLKRQHQEKGKGALSSGIFDVENSLLKAFSSMVYMMKEVQTYCLHIQRQLSNQEIEGLLNQVHGEVHASFLWLFQQVFSCTPELMVLLMVLLADFTAFSMASRVPMGMTASAPSTLMAEVSIPGMGLTAAASALAAEVSFRGSGKSIQASFDESRMSFPSRTDSSFESIGCSRWIGYGGNRSSRGCSTAAGSDGAFEAVKLLSSLSKLPCSVEDTMPPDVLSSLGKAVSAREGFDTKSDMSSLEEDGSYTCYARTDLAYQYALSTNTSNSMLLSNYAQFLFLVRKDHDRAEELFRRAVLCDPLDGDTITRFARFLWLARHNLSAAGKAYQAAVRADPSNPFHAADYAHFLWNSGQ